MSYLCDDTQKKNLEQQVGWIFSGLKIGKWELRPRMMWNGDANNNEFLFYVPAAQFPLRLPHFKPQQDTCYPTTCPTACLVYCAFVSLIYYSSISAELGIEPSRRIIRITEPIQKDLNESFKLSAIKVHLLNGCNI